MPTPIAAGVVLTDEERACLEAWSRRRKTAQALALRSRIVLAAADGAANYEIAEHLGVSRPTVTKWRNRFAQRRLEGLLDEPRPGRPRTVTDEQVERIVTTTLESAPKDATHWSTRALAAHLGVSQDAVWRTWQAFGLQPHRQEQFKLSADPQFIEKVYDICGLRLEHFTALVPTAASAAPMTPPISACEDEDGNVEFVSEIGVSSRLLFRRGM